MILASYGNGDVRVGNIRVFNLQGNSLTPPNLPENTIRLRNNKIVRNKLVIEPDQVSSRNITHFQLDSPSITTNTPVTAYLRDGSKLQVTLKSYDGQQLSAVHPLLGELAFPRASLDGLIFLTKPLPHDATARVTFKNGDQFTGSLVSWSSDQGFEFRRSTEETPILFPPGSPLTMESLERTTPSDHIPTAIVKVGPEDLLPGSLLEIDDQHLSMESPFSNRITIERSHLREIIIEDPTTLLYAGPKKTLQAWTPSSPEASWHLEDEWIIGRQGGIGRPVTMPERGRLDMVLAWDGSLKASVSIFNKDLTKDASPGCYRLYLEEKQATLFRGITREEAAKPPEGQEGELRNLRLEEQLARFSAQYGTAPMKRLSGPIPTKHNPYHRERKLTWCWDRKDGRLALYLNDELVKLWIDPQGLATPTDGLVLYQQARKSKLKIREIRLRQWNGILPDSESSTEPSSNETVFHLRNYDSLRGHLASLKDQRFRLTIPQGSLSIPLDRTRLIQFPWKQSSIQHRQGMAIKGFYKQCFGSCRFYVNGIQDGQAQVYSPFFGTQTFDLSTFRKLHFDIQDQALWSAPIDRWESASPPSMRAQLRHRQTNLDHPALEEESRALNEEVELDE